MNSSSVPFYGIVESVCAGKMKILLVSDVETKTKVEGELRIIACLSGKIRNNKIRITMGDKVKVNINPRNLQKASKDNGWISGTGTVVFREK